LRVIIVNDYAWVNGGASKVALGSAQGLLAAGVDVEVFAGSSSAEAADAKFPTRSLGQEHFSKVGGLPGARQGMWNTTAAREFSAFLKGRSAADTIIHVHSCRDVLSPSVVRMAKDLGFKVVYTVHDYGIGCPYGGFYDYKEDAICPRRGLSWACLTARCNAGSYAKKLYIYGKQAVQVTRGGLPKRVDAFAFVSEFSLRILRSYLPAHALVEVVPNPIEVERQPPAPLDGDYFLFVGRLTAEKDPVTLARAAAAKGFTVKFAGEGPMAPLLKEIYPEAELLGWQASADVQRLMRNAKALVFPSRWYEAQPLTVAEAMANGVPVIVSDACSGREPIEASGGGLVFRTGDVEDLASKMRALDDVSLRQRLAKAAYDSFWADPPTMARHVERLQGLYQRVLSA
jgi:glycosyltransferase involved in cell wall biosynthesis